MRHRGESGRGSVHTEVDIVGEELEIYDAAVFC
jgi:hypothetical protein